MTAKTPPAPVKGADPKDEKKDPAKGGPAAGQTGALPLKGGKDGVTKTLDNKGVLKAPEDPKVVKAGHDYALALERVEKAKDEANEFAQKLLDLFLESKKARKVRVITDTKTYYFSTASLTKLVTEKKQSVN